jgi:hypothetical protein
MKLQLGFINNIIYNFYNNFKHVGRNEAKGSSVIHNEQKKYKAKVILEIRESHFTTTRTEVSSSKNSEVGSIDHLLTALMK